MNKSAALALMVFSTSAIAELTVSDYLTPFDGLLTHDTKSGLYWLDLNFTSGGDDRAKSLANNFENISKRTTIVGDVLFGFRHATLSEVEELYLNAGMEITYDKKYGNKNIAETDQFLSMLGHTKIITPDSGSVRKHQWGWTATTCAQASPIICNSTLSSTFGNIVIAGVSSYKSADLTTETAYASLMDKNIKPTGSLSLNTGHYLVINFHPRLLREINSK